MDKRLFREHFRIWLALVGVATLVLTASYAMLQQSTRLSANDWPIAESQIVRQKLSRGAEPETIVPDTTYLAYSRAGFVIITDKNRKVLASSAVLGDKTPLPPKAVFDHALRHGGDTITWQPSRSVRLASYVSPYRTATDEGYVVTGQSLRPFEERVETYTYLALAAWLTVIAWATIVLMMPSWKKNRK